MSVRSPRSDKQNETTQNEWGHRDWGNGMVYAYKQGETSVWVGYNPDKDVVELSDWA